MNKRVLVDSDFCNMLCPGNDVNKDKEFFKSIFDTLNIEPVMHEFIATQELLINNAIQELIKDKYIIVIKYTDFLKDSLDEMVYVSTYQTFYKFMNDESISPDLESIKLHKAHKNMGEIHSLILAQFLNLPIFMSNDNGAKQLAITQINTADFSITVKNVCDVFCEIKQSGKTIDKKAVRSILKQREAWKERYDKI